MDRGAKLESGSPPSEAWLFSQLIHGRPVSRIVGPDEAVRERIERLAKFSSRHADELYAIRRAEADARHDREILEWAATISTRACDKLAAIERKEAEAREGWERAERFYKNYFAPLQEEWNEGDHPRHVKGTSQGGQFASKGGAGGGGSSAGSASDATSPDNSAKQLGSTAPTTKIHLPAADRGTWIKGTKGHGVFRYNDSPVNQRAGMVGVEIRYENQHIAKGGFPPEAYYSGAAGNATVEVGRVTATSADGEAADALLREKLGDPNWERPSDYYWNHAGGPGSKTMELVDKRYHSRVAHTGGRAAKARGMTGRAMGALTVYLATRDVLQAAGVLQPTYTEGDRRVYHFRDEDGSVFIVHEGGRIFSSKREYVDGPKKGQTEKISKEEVESLRGKAEEEFGKYIPGSIFRQPRFLPGKQQRSLPIITNPHGAPYEAGWIDEDGVHYHETPKPYPI